jgi:hypothetical protein
VVASEVDTDVSRREGDKPRWSWSPGVMHIVKRMKIEVDTPSRSER